MRSQSQGIQKASDVLLRRHLQDVRLFYNRILPFAAELASGVTPQGVIIESVKSMLMKEHKNRTRVIGIRLTPEEFDKLEGWRRQSTTPEISEFIRRVLFGKPITVNQRNRSLDDCMAEMMRLRSELNAIGNNFNQAVKRLHQQRDIDGVGEWAARYASDQEVLLGKIGAIKERINQIADQWLQ